MIIFDASIIVCKLLLPRYVQLTEFFIVLSLLFDQLPTILDLSLLEGLLSTLLVELSLPVLLALLKITESLGLPLLLFLETSDLSSLCFLTLLLVTLMLRNLVIKSFLGRASGLLLLQSGSVGQTDFLLHYLHTLLLGCEGLCVLPSNLLNVGKQLCLFLLELFLFLGTDFLA